MNRGSRVQITTLWITTPASMRPRFMNRGSCKTMCRERPSPTCFNEAPIHESGKLGCLTTHCQVSYESFNEAPIHESGK